MTLISLSRPVIYDHIIWSYCCKDLIWHLVHQGLVLTHTDQLFSHINIADMLEALKQTDNMGSQPSVSQWMLLPPRPSGQEVINCPVVNTQTVSLPASARRLTFLKTQTLILRQTKTDEQMEKLNFPIIIPTQIDEVPAWCVSHTDLFAKLIT